MKTDQVSREMFDLCDSPFPRFSVDFHCLSSIFFEFRVKIMRITQFEPKKHRFPLTFDRFSENFRWLAHHIDSKVSTTLDQSSLYKVSESELRIFTQNSKIPAVLPFRAFYEASKLYSSWKPLFRVFLVLYSGFWMKLWGAEINVHLLPFSHKVFERSEGFRSGLPL